MADSRLKGYECKFVESVKDDHICPICFFPIRQPLRISHCGHVFCESCLDHWISVCSASLAKCPLDNQTLILCNTFLDRLLDCEIKSLKVYCENHASGCTEQMELREYDKHCSTCPYKMVDCPLNCTKKLMNRQILNHTEHECVRRLVHCKLCKILMEYQLKLEHRQNCPQRVVSCDICHVSVIFKELDQHLAKCPDYETYCVFAPMGCSKKMKRKFLKSHHEESTQKHLNQLTLAALKLYTEVDSVPEKEHTVSYELPVSLMDKFAKKARREESVERLLSEPADSIPEESPKSLKQSIKWLKEDNKKLRKEVSEFTQEIVELKEKMNKLIQ